MIVQKTQKILKTFLNHEKIRKKKMVIKTIGTKSGIKTNEIK